MFCINGAKSIGNYSAKYAKNFDKSALGAAVPLEMIIHERMRLKDPIGSDRIKKESYITAALLAITGPRLLERLRLIQVFSFVY